MENVEQNKLSAFTTEYNKAKVKPRNTLWSKALLLSPLFSSSSKTVDVSLESDSDEALLKGKEIQHKYDLKSVAFSANARTIVFDRNTNDETTDGTLDGTQYLKYTHHGYQLNMGYHYDFLSYMVEILHLQYANWFGDKDSSPSTVTIDINTMIRHLGLDSKSKSYYKEIIYDLNSRLFYSSARLDLVDGGVINDRYVYKFEYNEDMSVFTIVFGDVFIDSIIVDSWKKKIDYLSQRALLGKATKQLYMLLQALSRPIEVKNSNKKIKMAELFVSSAIRTMSLAGSRKSNVESINDALNYLVKIGCVDKYVDDKQGGKSVISKKVYMNQNFDLEAFALKSAGLNKSELIQDAEVEYAILDKTEFMPTPVESTEALTTEQHVANIILTWGQNTLTPIASKASNPEQAVDVAPDVAPVVEIEIDPWDVEPDFEAWEREAAEPHRAMKDYNGPYKQWPDDEIYSEFDE